MDTRGPVHLKLSDYLKMGIRALQKVPGVHFIEYVEHGDLIYVINPKVATRTILFSFGRLKGMDLINGSDFSRLTCYSTKRSFKKKCRNKTVFTIIRNPADRIHSCWRQKVRDDDEGERWLSKHYFLPYYPAIRSGQSLTSFLRAVCRIPDPLSEKHFMSQVRFLLIEDIRYDRIFTLENLSGAESFVREFFPDFRISQPLNMTSKNLELSKEDLDIIMNRYQEDFTYYQTAQSCPTTPKHA